MVASRRGPYTPEGYWDTRYRNGRDSGEGSRGATGKYKAEFVNKVIVYYGIVSVIDWGCGDGQVLTHITRKINYVGLDVSRTIIAKVKSEHPGREFYHPDDIKGENFSAELALSMDVLFHFPDDSAYYSYLDQLFGSATRLVLIYATNYNGGQTAHHVRRRHFTPDVAARFPGWKLTRKVIGSSNTEAGFFLYSKG